MTKAVPELRWASTFSLEALFKQAVIRQSMEAHWLDSLDWRWAERSDWPRKTLLIGDFAHAKKGGFGFVTEVGTKRLFAVPRGWAEPEWELAEFSLADRRWRDLGYFEPWSPTWVRPTLPDHPSRRVR